MATVLTAPPAVEPISLAEVKAHLRIDTDDEDGLLQALILTSRLHVEVALGLALITQGWSCYFDAWPDPLADRGRPQIGGGSPSHALKFPIDPIKSVDAIRIYAADGTFAALPVSGFWSDVASKPARLARRAGTGTPTPGRAVNGIEIAVTAGFGPAPADVPSTLRHALLLLVAHWYEHRDPGEVGTLNARIPPPVAALLAPWTPVRL